MALDDYKIVDADYTGKDVSGLADKPTLTAAQLKARFDSLVKNVVAVKYNALIDAVTSAIAGFASKVTGATNGNFAALDADGQLTDSGKKATDFEAANAVSTHNNSLTAHGGIPTRHTVYKDSADSAWYKILSFTADNEAIVKIEGFSTVGFFPERGHWELIISKTWEGRRADLIFGTNGIAPDNVDVRLESGTFNVYFLMPPYTVYRFLSECMYSTAPITLTTGNSAETPSGTEITVVAARREESVAITLSSIVFQYEVDVAWATTDMWFEAIRTDETMSYFTHPIRAYCETAGKVKVYLNMYPDAAQNGTTMNVKISGWR